MIITDLAFLEETCEEAGICGGIYYGAVAISPSGDYGYSLNHSTRETAQNVALQNCEKVSPTDCMNKLSFYSPSPFTTIYLRNT